VPVKKKKTAERKPRPSKKWDDRLYIDVYQMARTGLSDTAICTCLKIDKEDFSAWKESRPALAYALEKARAPREQVFQEYVYGRLRPEVRECWDRICLTNADDDYDLEPLGWLQSKGKCLRQEVFLFALVHCNWNPSKACKKMGLTAGEYRLWLKEPEFRTLMQEMNWHKANFFEEALVGKIKEGDTNAIIFANRTINRDRGYGDKLRVEHTGTVQHTHLLAQIDLESLDLSLACRKEILTALRQRQEITRKEEPRLIEYKEVDREA
jgi:hypothetical protein